jgi:hypothetical protein
VNRKQEKKYIGWGKKKRNDEWGSLGEYQLDDSYPEIPALQYHN